MKLESTRDLVVTAGPKHQMILQIWPAKIKLLPLSSSKEQVPGVEIMQLQLADVGEIMFTSLLLQLPLLKGLWGMHAGFK